MDQAERADRNGSFGHVVYEQMPHEWYVVTNAAMAPMPSTLATGLRSATASLIAVRCFSADGLKMNASASRSAMVTAARGRVRCEGICSCCLT